MKKKKKRNEGLFNKSKNMDTLCLGFLYFGNSLRSIKRGFGCFSNPREALKMVFWRAFY